MTILDRFMPAWDATRVEHRVIDAPMMVVYDAALSADFLDAVRHHPIVRTLFAMRSWTERVVAVLRHRRFAEPPEPALRLRDMPSYGEWVRLGEARPVEFAFGVIGRFWGGETRWIPIDSVDFADFDRPGFAKIACKIAVSRWGDGRALLSYEARTRATDDQSRRAFLRYWRVVSPFVGIVMRATLSVIANDVAVRRSTKSGPRLTPHARVS